MLLLLFLLISWTKKKKNNWIGQLPTEKKRVDTSITSIDGYASLRRVIETDCDKEGLGSRGYPGSPIFPGLHENPTVSSSMTSSILVNRVVSKSSFSTGKQLENH